MVEKSTINSKGKKNKLIAYKPIEISLYNLKNTKSNISCCHKPKIADIKILKNTYNIDTFLTILSDKEDPSSIKEECNNLNIQWLHLPLSGANVSLFQNKETKKIILDALYEVYFLLKYKEINLFMHCSAGIHRTGTMLYTILRTFDEDKESALDALKIIRQATRDGVGSQRIEFAEKYLYLHSSKGL